MYGTVLFSISFCLYSLRNGAQPRALGARGSTIIAFVPREIKNNGYAKFWGVNKVHYGLCVNGELFGGHSSKSWQ